MSRNLNSPFQAQSVAEMQKLVKNKEQQIENDLEDFSKYQHFVQHKRREDVERGTKSVLMMEQMADTTWRPVVPFKEKERFLSNKIGKLKSRQSSSWSSTTTPPSMSPRNDAASALSIATFAGVTDAQYIGDMQRRLMHDRFKMHFRENTNIFPSERDIENANKKPPHSPRAISYVPMLVQIPVTVKPHRLKPINREYDPPDETEEMEKSVSESKTSSKKRHKSKTKNKNNSKKPVVTRLGPTQYQSNTGLVMVMKPQKHALVGTVYEHRPLKEEFKELQNYRVDADKLEKENTHDMLERCDRLLNPAKAIEKKQKKLRTALMMETPTDWNRTISVTPNLNDLRSVLGESPTLMAAAGVGGGRKTRNSKASSSALKVSTPISLEQIMKPEGKPKFYIDSVSKCVTWLNKNFS